jgi:hypothetical protein
VNTRITEYWVNGFEIQPEALKVNICIEAYPIKYFALIINKGHNI